METINRLFPVVNFLQCVVTMSYMYIISFSMVALKTLIFY